MNTVLIRHGTLAWLALCLATACSDVPAKAGSADPSINTNGASTTAGDSVAAPAQHAADSAFLVLEGGGLRVFLAATGSARPLPFGMTSTDVLLLLNAVLGTGPVEQGENADCAAEYAKWDNGLTVWFSNGRFAGWFVSSGSALTTADGIGLGTTRAALRAAYDPVITRSSVGAEFTIGELAGMLESEASDARVQHLWSGHVCIAR